MRIAERWRWRALASAGRWRFRFARGAERSADWPRRSIRAETLAAKAERSAETRGRRAIAIAWSSSISPQIFIGPPSNLALQIAAQGLRIAPTRRRK